MNKAIVFLVEMFLVYFVENSLWTKKKKPSLLAYNIAWFTDCTWFEQLEAFQQLEYFRIYKF